MNLILFEPDEVGDERTRGTGRTVSLSGPRAAHLLTVLKVTPGHRIRVGILDGPCGVGTVQSITGHRGITVRVEATGGRPGPGRPASAAGFRAELWAPDRRARRRAVSSSRMRSAWNATTSKARAAVQAPRAQRGDGGGSRGRAWSRLRRRRGRGPSSRRDVVRCGRTHGASRERRAARRRSLAHTSARTVETVRAVRGVTENASASFGEIEAAVAEADGWTATIDRRRDDGQRPRSRDAAEARVDVDRNRLVRRGDAGSRCVERGAEREHRGDCRRRRHALRRRRAVEPPRREPPPRRIAVAAATAGRRVSPATPRGRRRSLSWRRPEARLRLDHRRR